MDEYLSPEETEKYCNRLTGKWISAAKSRCASSGDRCIQWTLSFVKTRELMFEHQCTYCARPNTRPFRRNGKIYSGAMSIDRIDSDRSYVPLNVISACKICQKAKNNLGIEDFVKWVASIRTSAQQHPYTYKYDSSELAHPGFKAKYRSYESCAKSREISWELSKERALTCFQSPCFYCLAPPSNCYRKGKIAWKYTGIDRYNNDRGYEDGNCVPACFWCNRAKNDMPEGWFDMWVLTAQTNLPYVKKLFNIK